MTQPSLMKTHPSDADIWILPGAGDWPKLETIPLFSRSIVAACAPALKKEFKLLNDADLDERACIEEPELIRTHLSTGRLARKGRCDPSFTHGPVVCRWGSGPATYRSS